MAQFEISAMIVTVGRTRMRFALYFSSPRV